MERRLLDALFFGSSKSRKLESVRKQSNSRCPLGVLYIIMNICNFTDVYWCMHIRRGLLRCSFLTDWAMRDALKSGTSNWYSTRA